MYYGCNVLTVDVNGGRGLHELALLYSAIPHSAPVLRAVVFFARHYAQHRHGRLVPAPARQVGHQVSNLNSAAAAALIFVGAGIRRVQPIPKDLRRRRTADTSTGEIERLALGEGGADGAENRRRRRQQDDQVDGGRVELFAGAALHFAALEVAVVALVRRVFDAQVVATQLGLVFNAEKIR